MATINDVNETLTGLRDDWREVNAELRSLIKSSTEALTRVDAHLEKPFYKKGMFWFAIAQLLIFGVLLYAAIDEGNCVQLRGLFSVNCNL